jgi:predicted CXXCH cytochrome family protein
MGQPVYTAIVQPIVSEYCVTCHGPHKSKAGLRMDSAENLFKGADNGPVIEPGDAANSTLVKRSLLPIDADDHMPPQGKRQPTFNDLALLQWWIDAGAPTNKTVGELAPAENIVRILQARTKALPAPAQ